MRLGNEIEAALNMLDRRREREKKLKDDEILYYQCDKCGLRVDPGTINYVDPDYEIGCCEDCFDTGKEEYELSQRDL